MKKIYCQIGMLGVLLAFALPAFSGPTCVSPYVDGGGNAQTFEDKFGPFPEGSIRCNGPRDNARIVMQVNAFEVNTPKGPAPYGFRNLGTLTKDLEVTNGYNNWKIAVVVHSGGGGLLLNGNPHEAAVKAAIANPNVDVYLCLNTAAAKNWTTDMIIPGVKFVPAGLSAIMDFQSDGFKYVQP